MYTFSKTIRSIKNHGIIRTGWVAADIIADRLFDIIYRTDTVRSVSLGSLTIKSENKHRGVDYEPTYTRPFNKLLATLKLPTIFVFVDVGSGKGKILLLAARYGFEKNIGIEFSKELCDIANQNIASFRAGRYTPRIKIINTDVLHYSIKAIKNIFYLFNPFDKMILAQFLKNILDSLRKTERPLWLIFNNMPCHKSLLSEISALTKYGSYVFGSIEFVVYTNQ